MASSARLPPSLLPGRAITDYGSRVKVEGVGRGGVRGLGLDCGRNQTTIEAMEREGRYDRGSVRANFEDVLGPRLWSGPSPQFASDSGGGGLSSRGGDGRRWLLPVKEEARGRQALWEREPDLEGGGGHASLQ